jgi:putative SOS response-associated peptidase YedK
MCLRYFLDADGNVIAFTFAVTAPAELRKRFNIAPTQQAPIVRVTKEGARELAMARWGLVPYWAKDLAVGTKMINARGEGVETKPAFKAAVEKRRCIVPATGFFEWKGVARMKQPYAITLPDRHVFGFAGLWERWKPAEGGDPVETFAIMTTEANTSVAEIHDRMPVILPKEAEETWLHGDAAQARKLLTPYAGPINLRAVSRHVSNVNNEGPQCLDDAEPQWDSQQRLL